MKTNTFMLDEVSRFGAIALVLSLQLLGACCTSADLSAVHKSYITEFEGQLSRVKEERSSPMAFPATEQAIQTFRGAHPEEASALKHLDILDAMIHLQAFEFGKARSAVARAQQSPATLITGDGGYLRDELFLRALAAQPGGLIDAWEGFFLPAAQQDEARFAEHGDALAGVLNQVRMPPDDDGALYVAGVAANCYYHAGVLTGRKFPSQPDRPKPFYKKAKEVLERFLEDKDKRGSVADHADSPRLFFITIYLNSKMRM